MRWTIQEIKASEVIATGKPTSEGSIYISWELFSFVGIKPNRLLGSPEDVEKIIGIVTEIRNDLSPKISIQLVGYIANNTFYHGIKKFPLIASVITKLSRAEYKLIFHQGNLNFGGLNSQTNIDVRVRKNVFLKSKTLILESNYYVVGEIIKKVIKTEKPIIYLDLIGRFNATKLASQNTLHHIPHNLLPTDLYVKMLLGEDYDKEEYYFLQELVEKTQGDSKRILFHLKEYNRDQIYGAVPTNKINFFSLYHKVKSQLKSNKWWIQDRPQAEDESSRQRNDLNKIYYVNLSEKGIPHIVEFISFLYTVINQGYSSQRPYLIIDGLDLISQNQSNRGALQDFLSKTDLDLLVTMRKLFHFEQLVYLFDNFLCTKYRGERELNILNQHLGYLSNVTNIVPNLTDNDAYFYLRNRPFPTIVNFNKMEGL